MQQQAQVNRRHGGLATRNPRGCNHALPLPRTSSSHPRHAPSSAFAHMVSSRPSLVARATSTDPDPAVAIEPQSAAPAAAAAPPAPAPAPAPPAAAGTGYTDCVMFQAFGWESCKKGEWYKMIQSKVPDFKAAGFTHVWLPPPSSSPVAPQGYMPGQLYNLNSKYGNEEQLKELNKTLTDAGIMPLADIVINHRCACAQGADGVWNKFGDDVDHDGAAVDWDKWAITSNDPHFKGTGNPDTGEDYGPAPDLDHANPDLRMGLKQWLQHLHENIGFAGWRLDYVKGYGASFVHEYIDASVGMGSVNVGEFWTDLQWNGSDLDTNQDAARQKLCDWLDGAKKASAAFDFPTKGILQEAMKNTQFNRLKDDQGKAPGLIGWWPKLAVTFVDNHDTGSTQAHWPFPKEGVPAGYAYIITHPGIPCIFWEHYFDWGDELRKSISDLIDVRKRNGIKADSKLDILCAEGDMYVAKINDRVIVKLGPRFDMGKYLPKKEDGWTQAVAGQDFCVWEKAGA